MPPDTAVEFTWQNGKFSSFTVNRKWGGETEEGIRMGDSQEKFLRAHPCFHIEKLNEIYVFDRERLPAYVDCPFLFKLVRAYFENDKLVKIHVE